MSTAEISPSPHYTIGPIKILLDERDLPPLEHIVSRIKTARAMKRCVAIHCVTDAELILTLAALEIAGSAAGDRIEHGGVIPEQLIPAICSFGLCVVTQPNFIHDRGDRYARTIASPELPNLYRLRSLLNSGVKLAAGSDAPYGGANPWRAMQTAMERLTKEGRCIGLGEQISAPAALKLYQGEFDDPAGSERRVAVGATADLCLMAAPLEEVLRAPAQARVAATFVGGAPIYFAK
jgi:predicted amidohydrolase YtcJ